MTYNKGECSTMILQLQETKIPPRFDDIITGTLKVSSSKGQGSVGWAPFHDHLPIVIRCVQLSLWSRNVVDTRVSRGLDVKGGHGGCAKECHSQVLKYMSLYKSPAKMPC